MSRRGQILFFLPALLVFAGFVLVPLTATVWESVAVERDGRMEFVGTALFEFAGSDPRFRRSLGNNLVYMLWTLLFEVGIGLALAVGLQRENRLNSFLRIAFFSPAVLSMVVIGLVFGFFLKEGVGVFSGLLSENRALLTISVVSGWAYCGFYMIIFLAGLSAIPGEVLEAARLDGASGWGLFWRIQLPLLKEMLFAALVICFTGAFKAFDLFWVILPNQEHTSILSTLLVREVIRFDHRSYGSTLAVILTLLVLLVFGVLLAAKWFWGGVGSKAGLARAGSSEKGDAGL